MCAYKSDKNGQFKTIYNKYVLKFDFPNLQKNCNIFTIISQGKQNGHFLGNSGLFDWMLPTIIPLTCLKHAKKVLNSNQLLWNFGKNEFKYLPIFMRPLL